MPIGVEKVGLVNPSDRNIISTVTTGGTRKFPPLVTIQGDSEVEFEANYYKDTPESSKGRANWIVKPLSESPFTKDDKQDHIGDKMGLMVPAKFCGPFRYQSLEAFLNNPENKYPTRILLLGNAPFKIVGTSWSRTKGGSDIRQSPVKYGDDVWLNVQTEGLNGATLEVNIYNKAKGSDIPVYTYLGVKCYGGEVNLNIKNTFLWRKKTGIWTSSEEEFYIKIRLKGKKETLLDEKKDDEHARYLRINDKIAKRTVAGSTTNLPLKVSKSETNLERYEPCRFYSIIVTDEGKDIALFEEGKLKLEDEVKKEFPISEKIHFDLDKSFIRSDAKVVLDRLAIFLNDNPFIPVELGAHCDIRKDHAYNDRLSNERAASGVKYLIDKGITRDRIVAKGYGKRRLINKGEDISEDLHEQNRRLTIKFKIHGGDAMSIVYNTIAPDKSKKKEIIFKVGDYKTIKCFKKGTSYEHDKNVSVIELTKEGKSKPYVYNGKSDVKHKVFSNLSKQSFVPLDYILPHKTEPNQFWYHVHSCRYYSDKTKASVIVNVFPDIKWDFHFYVKLSNPLSAKWQGINGHALDRMQGIVGKIGAQKRWKQTEAAFGVLLKANWNKISKDNYQSNFEVTAEYEDKFKWLYEIFGSLQEFSKGVTSGTKGKITKTRLGKKLPFELHMVPPNVSLGAEWQLARGEKNKKLTKEIGTEIKFYLGSDPMIGLKMVIDLLGFAATAASIATTGNTVASDIFIRVKEWAAEGYESEKVEVSFKMYFDLIISGTISGDVDFKINTASDKLEASANLKTKLEVELTAGLELKAKIVIVEVAAVEVNGELSASGKLSIVFGNHLEYKTNDGLYYRPSMVLPPCEAKVVLMVDVGLSYKKISADWKPINYSEKRRFWEKDIKIIKNLEKMTGRSARVQLIKP